jgi:hypothetical protein
MIEKSEQEFVFCSFLFPELFFCPADERLCPAEKSSLTMFSGIEEREKNLRRVDCCSIICERVLRSSRLKINRGIKEFARIAKTISTAKTLLLSGK